MLEKIKQAFIKVKRTIPGLALDIADIGEAGNTFNGVKTKSEKRAKNKQQSSQLYVNLIRVGLVVAVLVTVALAQHARQYDLDENWLKVCAGVSLIFAAVSGLRTVKNKPATPYWTHLASAAIFIALSGLAVWDASDGSINNNFGAPYYFVLALGVPLLLNRNKSLDIKKGNKNGKK